ncbi:uncharacterized protein LOC144103512 [Amblyomma americanum]
MLMRRNAVLLFFLIVSASGGNCTKDYPDEAGNSTSRRSPRWGFFNWVEFANEPCFSRNGFSGVCLTSSECNLYGGVAMGRCAQGYGVCCQVSRSCGETISRNNSYFVDPVSVGGSLTPDPNGLLCSVAVHKAQPGVCQLRLNLERFDVIGPDVSPASGTCSHDAFHVSGQDDNSRLPLICGINHGQHVYVNVGQSSGPVRLSMFLAPNATQRHWRIRVIQIPCGSQRVAPSGCLQYHEDPTGVISSFNYASGEVTSPGSDSGRLELGYPNFQRYSICFRLAAGACSLRLSKAGPFGVYAEPTQPVGAEASKQRAVVNRCEEFRFRSPLQADFLMLGVQPFCGDDFPDSFDTVDTGATVISFVSNGTHKPEYAGFRLRYQMVPCVHRRHGLEDDLPTIKPPMSLLYEGLSGQKYQASNSFMLTDHTQEGHAGGLGPSSHPLPQPELYTQSGYFPEPSDTNNGGQIILYHKGVYKDLIMKLVRNLGRF